MPACDRGSVGSGWGSAGEERGSGGLAVAGAILLVFGVTAGLAGEVLRSGFPSASGLLLLAGVALVAAGLLCGVMLIVVVIAARFRGDSEPGSYEWERGSAAEDKWLNSLRSGPDDTNPEWLFPARRSPGRSPERRLPDSRSPESRSPDRRSPERRSAERRSPERVAAERSYPEQGLPDSTSPEWQLRELPSPERPDAELPRAERGLTDDPCPERQSPQRLAAELPYPERGLPADPAPKSQPPELTSPKSQPPELTSPVQRSGERRSPEPDSPVPFSRPADTRPSPIPEHHSADLLSHFPRSSDVSPAFPSAPSQTGLPEISETGPPEPSETGLPEPSETGPPETAQPGLPETAQPGLRHPHRLSASPPGARLPDPSGGGPEATSPPPGLLYPLSPTGRPAFARFDDEVTMVPRYPDGLRPDDGFRPATHPRPDDGGRDGAAPSPDAAPGSAKSPQTDAPRHDADPWPSAAQGPRPAPVTDAYPGYVNGQRSPSGTDSRAHRAVGPLPDVRNGASPDLPSSGSRDVRNGAWPDFSIAGSPDLPNGRQARSHNAAPPEFETHPVPAPRQPEPSQHAPAPDQLTDYGSSPRQEASDDTCPLPVVLPGGSARESGPSPDYAHDPGSPDGYQAESAASA